MKIAARIFTILSLIAAVGAFIVALSFSNICFHPSQEILDELMKAGELSQYTVDQVKLMLNAVGISFVFLAVWAVICLVLSIIDLVVLAKPLKKKPIVLGVFSLLFVNIVTGILMLCMNEDKAVAE